MLPAICTQLNSRLMLVLRRLNLMAGKFRKAFIRIKRSFRDVTKAGCDLGFSEMSSPTTHVCTPPTAGYTRWCMVSKRFKREATFKNGISLFSVEKNQRQIKCKKIGCITKHIGLLSKKSSSLLSSLLVAFNLLFLVFIWLSLPPIMMAMMMILLVMQSQPAKVN